MRQPPSLTHASQGVLEFDQLRDLLRGYATSPLGHARVNTLQPTDERNWIERQHRLTAEIRQYLKTGARFEFGGLLEVSKLLDKARIQGASLEPNDLREILTVADRADEWTAIVPERSGGHASARTRGGQRVGVACRG